jgi:hypothetical protein
MMIKIPSTIWGAVSLIPVGKKIFCQFEKGFKTSTSAFPEIADITSSAHALYRYVEGG